MLKKLFLLLFVIAPVAAFAQEKIAYVNAQEVFAKMPELAQVETKLNNKREASMKTAQAIEAEYQSLVDKFSKDTAELSESLLMDRQKQVEQLRERYEIFVQKSNSEFETERESLINPLQQKLMTAIKEVGDENNYTYIFDRAALLYVNPSATDISVKVKSKLNIKD